MSEIYRHQFCWSWTIYKYKYNICHKGLMLIWCHYCLGIQRVHIIHDCQKYLSEYPFVFMLKYFKSGTKLSLLSGKLLNTLTSTFGVINFPVLRMC